MLISAAVGIVSAAMLALMVAKSGVPRGVLLTAVGIHGLAVNAVQTTLYALATHLYTTRVRSTGTAFALAIGRTGAIVSAFYGAHLLRMEPSHYFQALAATMFVVLVAIQIIRNHYRVASQARLQ